MVPWKKSVGESRVDCSRVMVLDRKRRVDPKPEVRGWKTNYPLNHIIMAYLTFLLAFLSKL